MTDEPQSEEASSGFDDVDVEGLRSNLRRTQGRIEERFERTEVKLSVFDNESLGLWVRVSSSPNIDTLDILEEIINFLHTRGYNIRAVHKINEHRKSQGSKKADETGDGDSEAYEIGDEDSEAYMYALPAEVGIPKLPDELDLDQHNIRTTERVITRK